MEPVAVESAATSLHGLLDSVKRLAILIGKHYATGQIGALHVIYSRYQSISEQLPTEERLLPPDLEPIRQSMPPQPDQYYHYLTYPDLLAGLVSEYAFISLFRIAADSFASEQASRLVAMDAATRNTEHLLESLLNLDRRERHGQITREVLELIGARCAIDP
jgi:F-type H+-transporting ATPase subunit gamma